MPSATDPPSPPPPPRPAARALPHIPALDGLRGLAVIGVLLFHDGRLRGGYLGVDLFFVLSGFLITRLLLAEHAATGRIDLPHFWIRRARRLFPALLALVPVVAAGAARFAAPTELGRIRWDGLATLAYVANWRSIFAGRSYWALFSAPSPFAHTWSLGIEEQFYVLWPLLTLAVLRTSRGSARALLRASLALAVASAAALFVLYVPGSTARAYEGTDTRGAAILVGAALACALTLRPALLALRGRALDAAGLVALAGLAFAWARLDGESPSLYRGGFWATEIAALVLIACADAGPRSHVGRALAWGPITKVGLVSYGVYLWHWPIFVAITPERTHLGAAAVSAIRLAATAAVSLASYRWLEQPIRKRGIPWGRPAFVVPAAFAGAAAALLVGTRGARDPEPEAIRALPAGGVPEGSTKILVLGDSVAVALGDRMRFVQGTVPPGSPPYRPFVVARGIGDCSILHDQLPTRSLNNRAHDGGDCDAHWAHDADEVRPEVTLIVLGGGFYAPVQIDARWQKPCAAGWRAAYVAELRRNLILLGGRGGRIFLTLVPYPVGNWAASTPHALVDCFNDTLREAAAPVPGVQVLDLVGKLCPGGACTLTSQGAPIRPDGLHFDGLGGEEIARWVLGELRAAALRE